MLTKDDILKMTGLNEKDFYKQFPNPEDFQAKYGKKIEKFLRKKGIEQAQTGWQDTFTPAPLEMEDFDFDKNQKAINRDARQFRKEATAQGVGNQQKRPIMPEFRNMGVEDVGNVFNAASTIGKNVQKIDAAIAAKRKVKQENRLLKELSPLIARASQGDMDRPQRNYLRPEEMIIQPDTLHNPLGSGQGLYAKNGGEIANTFAPNTIYTDLGEAALGAIMEAGTQAVNTVGDMAAWIGGMNTRKIQKENEKLMGQMAMQPMLQNLQTTQYGSYMENGGMINPQIATSLEGIPLTKLFASDPTMNTLRTGGNIRQNQMAMGGNLKVDGRGTIDFMGYNPEVAKTGASGFVGISRGPSHDNGGFNLMYGEDGVEAIDNTPNMVEVEGNETVIETARDGFSKDKSLNILGDLHVGILDKAVSGGVNKTVLSELLKGRKLKDLKYKHLGNDIAKKTGRLNLEENKYLKMLDGFQQAPSQSYDLLSFNSAKAGIEGVQMRYKDLKNLQDNMIESQQAINTTSEDFNINKNKLASKGIFEPVKPEKSTTKAQTGVTKSKKETGLDLYNSGKIKEFQEFAQKNYPEMVKNIIDKYGTPKGGWEDGLDGTRTADFAKRLKDLPEYTYSSELSPSMMSDIQSQISSDMAGLESQYSSVPAETSTGRFDKNILDVLKLYGNQILPFIRPSDAEGLSPEQISGELATIATNQVVPVQMQKYSPQLRSNYYVSLADQLNKNEASYRAAQRMIGYNPAALASLNAQKYQANQQVLGEEFRLNQGLRDAVYSENLDKIAKADLINLELIDKQYGRQQEAISNTKLAQQAALNSVNAKILQNRAERRALQVAENMYNYRFDKQGRAINYNPLASFDIEMDGMVPVTDEKGNIVQYIKKEQKYDEKNLPAGSKVTTTTKQTTAKNGYLVKFTK
jgi:hypothetical protein